MKWQCKTCYKVFEKPLPRSGEPPKFCDRECFRARPVALRGRVRSKETRRVRR